MLPFASFTHQIDVPQLVFLLFALFFAGLVYHLRQEDKREGYPLESDRTARSGGRVAVVGWPPLPKPKTFLRKEGPPVQAPGPRLERDVAARPIHSFLGAPLEPTGDPLVDGFGPAAYALKEDVALLNWDGEPVLKPRRIAPQYHAEATDPDLVGLTVTSREGAVVGTVVDIWVDSTEFLIRYIEVARNAGGRVLMPMAFTKVRAAEGRLVAESLSARQFARIPELANPDIVTKREEDRISAYFAGGLLYRDAPDGSATA